MKGTSPETIHTAISELMRTGIDALRGIGLPFALADNSIYSVTWAEVMDGSGLRLLRVYESRMRATLAQRFTYQERKKGLPGGTLDASGKCCLESAPRACDLATAGAHSAGAAFVLVRRSFGMNLLGAFCARTTERGYGVLILSRAADDEISDLGQHRYQAVLGLPDSSLRKAVCTTHDNAALRDFIPLINDCAGAVIDHAVTSFLDADPSETRFAVICFQLPGGINSTRGSQLVGLFDAAAEKRRCGWVKMGDDLFAKWARGVDKGLEVDVVDWTYFHLLVARTRAVTSEKSRSQAG